MRATNAPASRKRRKRMLKLAKGFRLKRSKLYKYASDAVDHGRVYAYRDRRRKKREFRYLWQIRINAAARAALPYGLTGAETRRKMKFWYMLLAFVLIGFFIWLAENLGTFFGIWRYPNQMGAWATVSLGK